MSIEIIKNELNNLRTKLTSINSWEDHKLFNCLTLQFLCFKDLDAKKIEYELKESVTDGNNDGGIDYIYFDDEENRVILGQNKYSENLAIEDIVNEINKIFRTLDDFEHGKTGNYNQQVKEKLQNALDSLTEENQGNIDIYFTSLFDFNIDRVSALLKEQENKINSIQIFNPTDFTEVIEKLQSSIELVSHEKVTLDKANNYLEYENVKEKGVFVNLSSKSITALYNKHNTKGLFNLNIRRFVKSKVVDDGIIDSLNSKRDSFWFLNNGITIACKDFSFDGNKLNLYDFSIVNGGQTSTLIGTYKGTNNNEFFVPCKIIKSKNTLDTENTLRFYNNIAEATNSQKPIHPKDLKSNSPELLSLKHRLKEHNIALEIKRGERSNPTHIKIKSDDLAQLVFSFVNQKPGTSRSNKKSLFSNNKFYNSIFKVSYSDPNKIDFLVDLINLNKRLTDIDLKLKKDINTHFNLTQANVYANSKMALIGLLGIIYRLTNKDITVENLEDSNFFDDHQFVYGKFISNYKHDDINNKIIEIIKMLIEIISEEFEHQYASQKVTSISNFLKSDSKYLEEILRKVATKLRRKSYFDEVEKHGVILKRV